MENKINDLICLVKKNKQKLKMVALPVIVGVAILFFWFNGNSKPVEVASAEPVSESEEQNETNNLLTSLIYVDISGEVNIPGVYEVKEGTRLFQVIDMAGGLTKEANIDSLNRAEEVYDGEKIIVGSDSYDGNNNSNDYSTGFSNDGKVNINRADLNELQTLPNIGPAKAQNIIDYRNSNGKFQTINDILYVNGIGSKTFDSLKDLICV